MNGALFFGVIAIYLLICVAWGLLRGLSKARLRGVTIVFSAVAAIVSTLIAKHTYFTEAYVSNTLIPMLEGEEAATIIGLFQLSPTLASTLLNFVGALVAPALCLVFFILFSFLTWIVYLVFAIIFRHGMKEHNERCRMSLLRAGAVSLAQGLIVLVIVMIPVSCYFNVVHVAGTQAVEAKLVEGEDAEAISNLAAISGEINESAGAFVFRKMLGADALTKMLTDFDVNGTKAHLNDELEAMTSLVCKASKLGQTELKNYSTTEAQTFLSIADSFDNSLVLPTLLGEFLYQATDAWLDDKAFMEIEKPSMGEQDEMFAPFMDELLLILHDDARNTKALQNDFRTVAQMISTFAQNGIFSNMDNTDQLMLSLGKEGVVDSLVTTLGSNNSMKRLIPQITNLGIRAIGQALGIPNDVATVYNELLEDVAAALNGVANQSGAQQIEALTEQLETAFDNAGVPVDPEVLTFYASTMAHDLLTDTREVTTSDVQAFFALYATHTDVDLIEARSASASVPMSGKSELILAGTVYENMTEEELASTGAAALAGLFTNLSQLTEDEDISKAASEIVKATFETLLEEDDELIEHLSAVVITKPVSSETIKNAASLDSSANINTQKVTMTDLLVDVSSASAAITQETLNAEAKAISSIFGAANEFVGADTTNMDLNSVANSVGTVLDALSETSTFGSEKTAGLFTAVFQSETVRNTANVDMATATKMAQKATEGKGKYTETLTSVSHSINALTALEKNENLTQEQMVELIQNINPQTAGMMEVYVTPKRLVGFGAPAESADTSSALLVSMFSYMGREDLKDYDAEAKALNQVLSLVLAAKDDDSKLLFSSEEGKDDGRLPTQKETFDTLMASHAITFAVTDVLTDGEKVTDLDPFGVKSKIGEDGSDEIERFIQIAKDYKVAHPETDDLTLEAMAALFGVVVDF